MRRLLPLVLTALVTACGGTGAAHHAAPAHRPPPRRRTVPVVVTASVLDRRGTAPEACYAILTSAPPAGCSGVRVVGYDFRRLPGLERFTGGWQTPLVRIAGAWDGHALRVSRVGRAGSGGGAPASPPTCALPPARRGLALVRRIQRDVPALRPLAFGPCGRTAWMLVPYAGRDAVAAIHARFGRTVIVSGWLLASREADR
jgi:hypothetical protein